MTYRWAHNHIEPDSQIFNFRNSVSGWHSHFHEPWIQMEARDRDMISCGNHHTFSWLQMDISDSEQSTKKEEVKESSFNFLSLVSVLENIQVSPT